MKKTIIAFAALLVAISADAQEFTFGPKAGLNVTNVSKSGGNMKPSIYLGGFAEYRFGDYFGLSSELVYSRQGFNKNLDGNKACTRINYLNLPVLAKIYVIDELSLDLGPQFGLLINAKEWDKVNDTKTHRDISKHYDNFDISFAMGVTWNIERFFLQGRYNIGLTDIANGDYIDKRYKNHVFQLGAGFRF